MTVLIEHPRDLFAVCTKYLGWREVALLTWSYFTLWTWFIFLVVPYLFSRGVQLLLALCIGVGGIYIAHIHPRRLVFGEWVVCRDALFFADLVLHQVPLLVAVVHLLSSPVSISGRDFFVVLGLVVLYLYLNDPVQRYGLREGDIWLLGLLATVSLAVGLTCCSLDGPRS